MIFNNAKNKKGQLLIETLVALVILTTGFLGILGLLSRSLSLNRVVAEQYQANYLAAEGLEIVKNVIDQNIQNGLGFNEGFKLPVDCFEVVYNQISVSTGVLVNNGRFKYQDITCPSGIDATLNSSEISALNFNAKFYDYSSSADIIAAPFKRYIKISCPVVDVSCKNEIIADSYVDWISRGGGQFEVHLEDTFYNWRQYAK